MRIGLHSGAAYSGVLGESLPRYCFFGDAVATARSLQRTGLHAPSLARLRATRNWRDAGSGVGAGYAMNVHVSGHTKKLLTMGASSDRTWGFVSLGQNDIKGACALRRAWPASETERAVVSILALSSRAMR